MKVKYVGVTDDPDASQLTERDGTLDRLLESGAWLGWDWGCIKHGEVYRVRDGDEPRAPFVALSDSYEISDDGLAYWAAVGRPVVVP